MPSTPSRRACMHRGLHHRRRHVRRDLGEGRRQRATERLDHPRAVVGRGRPAVVTSSTRRTPTALSTSGSRRRRRRRTRSAGRSRCGSRRGRVDGRHRPSITGRRARGASRRARPRRGDRVGVDDGDRAVVQRHVHDPIVADRRADHRVDGDEVGDHDGVGRRARPRPATSASRHALVGRARGRPRCRPWPGCSQAPRSARSSVGRRDLGRRAASTIGVDAPARLERRGGLARAAQRADDDRQRPERRQRAGHGRGLGAADVVEAGIVVVAEAGRGAGRGGRARAGASGAGRQRRRTGRRRTARRAAGLGRAR